MTKYQSCRICLKETNIEELNSIYEDGGIIGADIFSLSGIKIIDITSFESVAKICDKCLKQLKKSIDFKNLIIKSDQHYRRVTKEIEEECWNKMLISFKCDSNEIFNNEFEISVKCEPLIDEYENEDASERWSVNNWFTEDIQIPSKKERTKKKNVKVDSKKKSRKCQICNQEFSSSAYDTYSHHMQRHKKLGEWNGVPCSKCDLTFVSHWSLGSHINKIHPIIGNLICDVCGKLYPNRKKMKDHYKDMHIYKRKPRTVSDAPEKKLPCTICGKFFKGAFYLKKHERLHNPLRPSEYFYCDLCGNKFKEKAAMHTHIRFTHLEKRRFHCPDCPGRSWSKKNGLKRHISSFHQNIREHKCEICGKEFHALHGLKNHQRIHTGEHPYECRFCERKFIHNTDWRRHQWGHQGFQGNIRCPNCNQGFFKNSDLRSHLTRCFT